MSDSMAEPVIGGSAWGGDPVEERFRAAQLRCLAQRSREHAQNRLLQEKGIARLSEFTGAGITAAMIGRMVRAGDVNRLARGLYQLPDTPLDANHDLAEAAKRVPRGVVCLVTDCGNAEEGFRRCMLSSGPS